MVARCRPEPTRLVVTFTRDGEEPISVEVRDGEQAIVRAMAMVLMHKRLQAGDTLSVAAAE